MKFSDLHRNVMFTNPPPMGWGESKGLTAKRICLLGFALIVQIGREKSFATPTQLVGLT